jgi:hypothetical protein
MSRSTPAPPGRTPDPVPTDALEFHVEQDAHSRVPLQAGERERLRPPPHLRGQNRLGADDQDLAALCGEVIRAPIEDPVVLGERGHPMQGRYLRPANARFGQSGSACRARARLTKSARPSARISSAACGVLTRPATPTEDLGRGRERRTARALPAATPRLHHPLPCLVVARRHVDEVEQVQAGGADQFEGPPGVQAAGSRLPAPTRGCRRPGRVRPPAPGPGTASAARTHRSAGWSPATGTGGSDSRGRRRNTR